MSAVKFQTSLIRRLSGRYHDCFDQTRYITSIKSSSTTIMSARNYSCFFLGNPLLDMQVTGGEKLLEKYELKSNDAILAEDKHSPM